MALKKAPCLLGLFFIMIFCSAAWGNSIHERIKAETIKGLKANFNAPGLTIGKASGLIVGQVMFEDVVIPNFAAVKKIYVNYNLVKFTYYKDIVLAISKITIVNGNFKVKRNKVSRINALDLLLPANPNAPPPPPFYGRLIFKDCQISYEDQLGFRSEGAAFQENISAVAGEVSFQKKDKVSFSLSGKSFNKNAAASTLFLNGSKDFKTGNYSLKIKADKLALEKWGNYVVTPLVFEGGSADLFITLTPSKTKDWPVTVSGEVSVQHAGLNSQQFSGAAAVSFQDKQLNVSISRLNLYRGTLSGNGQFNFTSQVPRVSFKTELRQIDLASLAQNSPGIVGRASGRLSLSGPLTDLAGKLSARLDQAMLFGQPMTALAFDFGLKDGDFNIQKLNISSDVALIQSHGQIAQNRFYDLKVKAAGIRLSGAGPLGKMAATVDSFAGDIAFELNKSFFASPLKNIKAEGEAALSQGQIGQQLFDSALGKVTLGSGLVKVENVVFTRNNSSLTASGETGIGYPTQLIVSGQKIALADLKILNYLLPTEAKDPTGTLTSLALTISGTISKETPLTSLEPLFGLSATGEVVLDNATLAAFPITSAKLNFSWLDRQLSFPDCSIKSPGTELTLKGSSLSGLVDLNELKGFTRRYGSLGGKLALNLIFKRQPQDLDCAASFWLQDFYFNSLKFDKISGAFSLADNKVSLRGPLIILAGADRYQLTGQADFTSLKNSHPEETPLSLKLTIIEAKLASALGLAQKIQAEISRKLASPSLGPKTKVKLAAMSLPTASAFSQNGEIRLYAADQQKNYFLKAWQKIARQAQEAQAALPQQNLGGQLAGKIVLQGKLKNLAGTFEGEVKNGSYQNYSFDSITTAASLSNQKISLQKLELKKKNGWLAASGQINLNGQLALSLTTKNLSLDILKSFFNEDFKGAVSLRANIYGSMPDPDFSASLTSKDLSLAHLDFDQAALSISKKNNLLSIHNFTLAKQTVYSTLEGSIQLSAGGELDLTADLKDNALGLINLFTPEIKWLNGKGSLRAKISGTLNNLDINGQLKIADATLYARALDAEIRNLALEGQLNQGLLTVNKLTGFWQGETSKNSPNFIGLAGKVDLGQLFGPKPMIRLDLAISPTLLYVDLPNLCSGIINLKKPARLSGPFYFDFSQGPLLSAQTEVSNALLQLSQSPGGQQVVPLNLDLDLSLKKNVYVTMGNIATFDLSTIFMDLEVRSDDLKVSGSLAAPVLLGKVELRRGSVNIFSREFTLLSASQQQQFYPLNVEKIEENFASFTAEQGIKPKVSIVGKVDVEETEKNQVTGEKSKNKVSIIAHLKGIIGAKNKEDELKIAFDSFREDTTKSPPEMSPASYSDQDIKVLLLPDFIKSLTGISKGEEATIDTNVVVADYLTSRLQSLVFRGIERQLEQKLGLESLTLEYNFGKRIRQEMGIKDVGLAAKEPDWRVGFVKGFFDKLYLDMRYSETLAQGASAVETSVNYQITYKLSPVWSIMYYREPPRLEELAAGYQKVTLQAGLSFW